MIKEMPPKAIRLMGAFFIEKNSVTNSNLLFPQLAICQT